MANFGKRPISNADKSKPSATYFFDGEERLDRRPQGMVSRFVDSVGNVVSIQLAADGDPNKAMTVDRKRLELRADGFVEHARCPLLHGTHMATPAIRKDFDKIRALSAGRAQSAVDKAIAAKLPAWSDEPCTSDPKVMKKIAGDLHAQCGCGHIEALIAYRREYEHQQNLKRNEARIKREEFEARKRQVEERQIAKAMAEMDAENKRAQRTPSGAKE